MNRLTWRFLIACLAVLVALRTSGFTLEGRVVLTREHVDLRIQYSPGSTNELWLVARDEDHATNYASTNVVLVVGRSAQVELPDGFPEFGKPGAPFWILPASQDPTLLYLGVSAEGLPRNILAEPLTIRLVEVRAPGAFFVWQFDSGGELAMKIDSGNGIGPDDELHSVIGSHEHFNWGFSSNGFYEATFRVEGHLPGAATNLAAADTTFLFAVEPLPTSSAPPAVLSLVTMLASRIEFLLTGEPGVTYRLQSSPDLSVWTDDSEVMAGVSPVRVSVPTSADGGLLFVRALSP